MKINDYKILKNYLIEIYKGIDEHLQNKTYPELDYLKNKWRDGLSEKINEITSILNNFEDVEIFLFQKIINYINNIRNLFNNYEIMLKKFFIEYKNNPKSYQITKSGKKVISIDKKITFKSCNEKQLVETIITELKYLNKFKTIFYNYSTSILFSLLNKYNPDYKKSKNYKKNLIFNYISIFRDEILVNNEDEIQLQEKFLKETQDWLNYLVDIKLSFDLDKKSISNAYRQYYFFDSQTKVIIINVNHMLLDQIIQGIFQNLYEFKITNN